MKREFTSKDLHIQLKRGKDIEFMLEKYGLKDEDELFKLIRKIIPGSSADTFISKLQRNSRKSAKKDKTSDNPTLDVHSEIHIQQENDIDASVPERKSYNHSLAEEEMKRLSKDEAELSRWLCKLESEHKLLVQKRSKVFDSLREAKKDCQELLERVEKIRERVEEYRKQYEDISKEMFKYNNDIGAAKEIIQDVRDKMSRLRVISIFIYEDGRIELEGAEIPEILDGSINILFNDLINRHDAEELTIKSVKSVAQLILIVKHFQEVRANFELYFDNSKVQDFYDLISEEFLQ